MKTRYAKWLGVLLIGLMGCYDYSNFNNIVVDPFSPAYVFPIINSKITFKELAEKTGTNSIVEQHPGSDMYFISFRDTIDIGLASNLFPSIPAITFNDSYQLGAGEIPGIFPAGTQLGPLTKSFSQTYNTFAGAELKRIDLSGGSMQFNLTNNYNHSISGNITITSLKDATGSSKTIPFTLNSLGSTSVSTSLAGCFLDLYPQGVYNTIQYSVTATITSSGNPSLAGNIAIQLAIASPIYQKLTGKITYTYIHSDQPYSIGIFASTLLAKQHIADPKFSLRFINSFGLPASVNFTRLEVENRTGVIPIAHEGPNNTGDLLIGLPNILKYPTGSKIADTTNLKLNKDNSNIENLFDVAPNSMSFGATFNIGDAANPSHDFFVKNDSKFQLQSDIEIPLKGWVVTNKIADTIPNIDWPDFEKDFKLVDQKIKFKFKFTNGLPIDMYLQAYFLDQTGLVKVDSLFDSGSNWFVKSAPVNPTTGESNGTTPAWSYISVDKAKYNKISQSKDMILVFMFKTRDADLIPTPQTVTILSTNSVAVEMSIEASGTVKL